MTTEKIENAVFDLIVPNEDGLDGIIFETEG